VRHERIRSTTTFFCAAHSEWKNRTVKCSSCRTRLRGHLQPVPPIFQPGVVGTRDCLGSQPQRAGTVCRLADRRGVDAQEMAPSFADQCLVKHADNSQQTSEPVSSGRPDNLFEPVHGEYSAHGMFDDRAKSFSAQKLMNLKTDDPKGPPTRGDRDGSSADSTSFRSF
jgi:hypothetical protein